LLTAGRNLDLIAGGAAERDQVTGNAVTAGEAVTLAGQVLAVSLAIQGAAAALGSADTAITQRDTGAISVRATAGTINGRAELTLISDSAGDGTRDLLSRRPVASASPPNQRNRRRARHGRSAGRIAHRSFPRRFRRRRRWDDRGPCRRRKVAGRDHGAAKFRPG
jgi:hypothetical protein